MNPFMFISTLMAVITHTVKCPNCGHVNRWNKDEPPPKRCTNCERELPQVKSS